MGMIAFASAKGSPGATTAALAVAALWPRPVILAECDPAGGDVGLRMPAEGGGVLDLDRGLLSLAAAGRKSLHAELVPQHTQRVVGGLDVLLGVRVPEQAAGLTQLWPALGPALAEVPNCDVVADLGRIGPGSPQSALLAATRVAVLVTDDSPSSVAHLRERLQALEPLLQPGAVTGCQVAIAVVADPRRGRAVREVEEALARTGVPLLGVWHLARDAKGAGFFAGRIQGRADRTLLVRSAGAIAHDLAERTGPFFAGERSPEGTDDDTDGPADGAAVEQPTSRETLVGAIGDDVLAGMRREDGAR